MNRRLGLTALAVVLALIGTVAVFAYAKSADRRAVDGIEAASVLIVDETIPLGTSWNEVVEGGFVSEEKLPVRATPSTALRDLDADVPDGQVATAEIKPGQVVVRAMFGEKAPVTGKLAIPARKQAITIEVPASAEVAGFVRNGSEVAVYVGFEVKNLPPGDKTVAGDKIYGSKLVVPRVSVIAVNQAPPSNVSGTGDEESSGLSRNTDDKVLVTLAVDQQDAEEIVLAQELAESTLYLTLLTGSSVTKEDGGGRINLGDFGSTPIFK